MSLALPIFTYHALCTRNGFGNEADSFYSVGIDQFERQISFLSRQGYRTLLIDELARSNGKTDRQICITFDDGLKSDIDFAVPILQKHGFRATFFVVLEFIGLAGYMSWADLQQILARGGSIQCHGLRHVDLTQFPGDDLLRDLRRAKSSLEENLGSDVTALAVPYGGWNKTVIDSALGAGFQTVLTSEQKLAQPGASRLPRLVVHSGTTDEQFQKMAKRERGILLRSWLIHSGIRVAKSTLGQARYSKLKRKLFPVGHTPRASAGKTE